MPSLLLVTFLLQLTLHLINTIGTTPINESLWSAYSSIFPSQAGTSTKITTLKREVVRLKRELAATSAQDDFAKWAKLRRQHDKAAADYEKIAGESTSAKTAFISRANTFRTVLTTGLKLFLQFWYSRQALFWIPKGWVPYYAEWILSFPRAPLGSVSLQVWTLACSSVVAMVSEALVATLVLAMGVMAGQKKTKAGEKKKMERPMTT
ncbi:putative Protein get1 [Venturia nashicola]|uniref:Uncharacterized protein n=1 Tax=Venturia nashicola TaxID=86259 RepID=A0A4Z1P0Q6_9PEZI|nr:putative Protein get1 [Venturia nashicola]TLD18963.1 putative Protein get1 [Venturia nashicola]